MPHCSTCNCSGQTPSVSCRCVMDQAPRELAVQQLQLLPHFAEMVVRHLERDRKALLQQAAAGRLLTRSIECVSEVQPGRLPQLAGRCVPMGAAHCRHGLCSV